MVDYFKQTLQGDIGEEHVSLTLKQKGIDTVPIKKTYDLLIWENDVKIEVKTSHLHTYRNERTEFYKFTFQPYQIKKDAFHYAVCLGLDDFNNVIDTYIIPQNALPKTSLCIHPKSGYYQATNSDKYNITKDRWDLLTIKNRSYLVRVKNKLAKEINNYEANLKAELKKIFIKVFNNPEIKKHNKASYIIDNYGITKTKVYRLIKEWKLDKA